MNPVEPYLVYRDYFLPDAADSSTAENCFQLLTEVSNTLSTDKTS